MRGACVAWLVKISLNLFGLGMDRRIAGLWWFYRTPNRAKQCTSICRGFWPAHGCENKLYSFLVWEWGRSIVRVRWIYRTPNLAKKPTLIR
jgi:hypothetical protein